MTRKPAFATNQSPNTLNHATMGGLQVIVAAICWGTLGIFTTYLHQLGFDSVQIAILRVVTAAMMLPLNYYLTFLLYLIHLFFGMLFLRKIVSRNILKIDIN